MRINIFSIVFIAATLMASISGTIAIGKEAKDKKVYYLYGDARPGTKFKQKLFKDTVPFNRRYNEMSAELQGRVKAAYGGLKTTEHPPFPTEGSQAIFRPLFKANRELRSEGDLLAIAMISATGKVKSVTIYKAPNANLATMLNYIITNTKFDHATCDGEPCEMEYLFENKIETKPSRTR